MEMIVPVNPLAESVGRLLPLFEKWLEKQVGEGEAMSSKQGKMLTPMEAAKRLRFHWQTVTKWCREGDIACVKIGGNGKNGKGGKFLIPLQEIERLLGGYKRVNGRTKGDGNARS